MRQASQELAESVRVSDSARHLLRVYAMTTTESIIIFTIGAVIGWYITDYFIRRRKRKNDPPQWVKDAMNMDDWDQ